MERTLAIIKPDAMQRGHKDAIIAIIKKNGFSIVAQKETQLSEKEAGDFYAEHKERPFFGELVSFMTVGPVTLLVLEKENAVQAWRDLMGATDPLKAEEGTIRKAFGISLKEGNATHGSDSLASAAREVSYFFPEL